MKNLFLSIVVVCALVVAGVGGVLADWTEDDEGDYCLQAGYLNLVLDLGDGVEIDLDDIGSIVCAEYLEPGDTGEETLSIHIKGDDSIVSAELVISGTFNELEGDRLEPEIEAGDTTDAVGELDDFLTIKLWWDDGDNVFEQEPIIYEGTLSGLMECLGQEGGFSLGQLDECVDYWIGIEWHLLNYDEEGGANVNQCMTDKCWGDIFFEVTNPIHDYSP